MNDHRARPREFDRTWSPIFVPSVRRGLRPVLAGRSSERLAPLAARLGLEQRAFSLEDPGRIAAELEPMDAVLLAAGPFSATSRPVVEACLRTGTHYLDITGEVEVFEACFERDAEARAAGCVLLPGVASTRVTWLRPGIRPRTWEPAATARLRAAGMACCVSSPRNSRSAASGGSLA